jgi:hypothetical protein
MTDLSERERLSLWLAERGLTYKALAHQMKWSPTFIYGALEGAWQFSGSFRWAFAQEFGLVAAAQVFDVTLLKEQNA